MSAAIYVVMCRAGGERVAMADLLKKGVAAYTPVQVRWVHPDCGRRRREERGVLPRYLFVSSADIEADYDVVKRARRVTGLLGEGETPLAVDADWVARLLVAQTFGLFDHTSDRKPKMSVGQMVRIIAGQFKGVKAKLAVISGAKGTLQVEGRFGGRMTLALDKLEAVA